MTTTKTTTKPKAATTTKRAAPVIDNLPNNPFAFEVLDLVSRTKNQ